MADRTREAHSIGRMDEAEAEERDDEAVELEVTDVLDLHSFPPKEIGELVRDYLDLACERGFAQVRIVHGRGVGVQRERVRRILERDARVEAFGDAPGEAGGWGATWARLRATSPAPTTPARPDDEREP